MDSPRHDVILELLQAKKRLGVGELCAALYCSPSTLRRDLIHLEKMGLVRRTHGGVSLPPGNTEYSSDFRENEHIAQKEAICAIALDFLANGMTLFLDSSSTVLRICPYLERYRNITVVTNGIRTALQLNESSQVDAFITGGHLKNGSTSLLGEFAGGFVEGFRADLAIVSCRGLDEQGSYEADSSQAWIKQRMLRNAKSAILLCDSSKFGHSYFYKLAPFSQFSAVLTDALPTPAMQKAVFSAGCELLY
ncbi:MAG: DeoR/GlpR family DNA-binding transcription regulator [Eubacteriales bacterium]|nr:DeoR/GlpR family DNA-binding transcription regulator [Eubacteriales bacterium]